MSPTAPVPPPGEDLYSLRPWSGTEREAFFDAIARHRRAAWRVTAICALAYAVLALVVAVLMAPLLYSLLGLALDLVNLAIPTPDLLHWAAQQIDRIFDARPRLSTGDLVSLTALAAAPGLALMGVVALALRRALMRSALADPDRSIGRAPNPAVLAEQRFRNTVEEMALAAGIPAPRVLVLPRAANAAAFGPDDRHATVLVGESLLGSLNREEMQGVAGHLIASVADGDMRIGLRTAMVLGLFALTARLSSGWSDRTAFLGTRRLVRALMAPTASNLDYILDELSDPFAAHPETRSDTPVAEPEASPEAPAMVIRRRGRPTASPGSGKLSWKEWALMPLMGPVFLSGFLSGLVNAMLLSPVVALAWRQRKYMADATAVRLTRDPDGLAGALGVLSGPGHSIGAAYWAGHLCVVDPGAKEEAALLGGSFVPIFPSPQRRIGALVKMGADAALALPQSRLLPLWAKLVLAALGALVAGLLGTVVVLLVWLSAALSGLFTVVPVAILHALLR